MVTQDQQRQTTTSRFGAIKSALDMLATVAIIAACGTLVWVMVSDRLRPATPAPATGPQLGQQKPTIPPPKDPVPLTGAALRGNSSAKVALIEYSDFQCPFCGVFARETLPQIEKKYVDTGKVLLAFRHLPLSQIHPFATKASEAAECAGRQGKFWEMHDRLFSNQKELDEVSLRQRARDLGLKDADFAQCLAGQASAKVQQEASEAATLGITGTPTFFLGMVNGDGRVSVARRVSGALPMAQFESALDALLIGKQASK